MLKKKTVKLKIQTILTIVKPFERNQEDTHEKVNK